MKTLLAALIVLSASSPDLRPDPYFRVTVVDEETGRPVPLIELRTVNDLRFYTDSAGVVAFHEPGLMEQSVYFYVSGHGYEFPADGFGFRGRKLTTTPGGSAELKIRRINIAERLYRITGAGIYAESVRVGQTPPIRASLLNAQVTGSDSVQVALLGGRIHWFWGDTNRPSYPLGLFHAPGATSRLPADGGLDPNTGVDLDYFTGPDGFAKATCKMPGEGPTWIDGLAVVSDADGRERLLAHYVKVKPPLTVYQQGLAEFNPISHEFEPRLLLPESAVSLPGGHPFRHQTEDGVHIYFAKPFPVVRVLATPVAVLNPDQYESFTCLAEGSREAEPILDRDSNGGLRYSWKRNTPPFTPDLQKKLLVAGKLQPLECLYQVRDILTNKPVVIHNGSVNWNAHRRRWILIASEIYGTSLLGEVWYAEADTPVGPWAYARKIVTHQKQSFYNPKHHPFFDQQNGEVIFFEGTYTHSFSGNDERTPRYEYNQIMYRMTLSDQRLALPAAVYRESFKAGERLVPSSPAVTDGTFRRVAFFAYDRPVDKSIPVYAEETESETILATGQDAKTKGPVLFYALSPEHEQRPSGCVPLFELQDKKGRRSYSTTERAPPEMNRSDRPIGYVWPAP